MTVAAVVSLVLLLTTTMTLIWPVTIILYFEKNVKKLLPQTHYKPYAKISTQYFTRCNDIKT